MCVCVRAYECCCVCMRLCMCMHYVVIPYTFVFVCVGHFFSSLYLGGGFVCGGLVTLGYFSSFLF